MGNEAGVLALAALILAVGLAAAMPGALALRSSSRNGAGEIVLERKLHDLEVEVAALRQELALARADRDRQAEELAKAKARIEELERLVAGYERQAQSRATGARAKKAPAEASQGGGTGTGTGERREALVREVREMQALLGQIKYQIITQGGDSQANAGLVLQRDELEKKIRETEGAMDELPAL